MTFPAAIVGFDVGGQSVKGVLVDHEGRAMASGSRETGGDTTADMLVLRLRDLRDELCTRTRPEGARCDGLHGRIGVGVPGVLDADGTLVGCPNVPHLRGLRLAETIAEGLGCDVVIDNDAHCAALAEAWVGAVRGRGDFLLLTLGTGVGSAVMYGGRILRGVSGHGCELGHMIIVQDGRTCGCGNRGCLEAYISEIAVRRRVEEGPAALRRLVGACAESSGQGYAGSLFRSADGGDAGADALAQELVTALGTALGSAVNVLDITTVVLAGGIAPEIFSRRPALEQAIQRTLFARDVSQLEILQASAGTLSGAIGAARLASLTAVAS